MSLRTSLKKVQRYDELIKAHAVRKQCLSGQHATMRLIREMTDK